MTAATRPPSIEAVLCDTSVIVRFFHADEDDEQAATDVLYAAWGEGRIELLMLDLSVYEFLNVLTRGLGWDSARAARGVRRLFDLELPVIHIDRDLAVDSARFAANTGLSGYDAAFVAAARSLEVPLVTTDRRIIERAPDTAVALSAFMQT